MKRYKVVFIGRLKNAIGIDYPIRAEVEGRDEIDANVRLYDTYEHVSWPTFQEIERPLKNA